MKYIRQFLLLVLLVAVCILSLYSSYVEVKTRSIDYLNRQQATYARQAAGNIQEFFDAYVRKLKVMSNLDRIISLDQRGRDTLQTFYASNSDEIMTILWVDAEGTVVHCVPYDEDAIGTNLSQTADMRKAIQDRQTVVGDVFTLPDGAEAVAVNVPVLENGLIRGCLRILVLLDYLVKRFVEDIRIGEDGYAWLIDARGIEIYCPVPGHTGKSVFENCRAFPSILAMARRMLTGAYGTTQYEFNHLRGDTVRLTRKHAAYHPIRLCNTLWSIVVATPEEEVLGSILGFRNRLLFISLILLTAFAFHLHYVLRSLIRAKEEKKRKAAEEALRASETRYREVVESQGELVARFLPDFTLTFANEAFCRYFRKGPEEFMSLDIRYVLAGVELDAFGNVITGLKAADSTADIEHPVLDPAGSVRWLQWNVRGTFDGGGAAVDFQMVGRDITERKLAEAALTESEQQLQEVFQGLPVATMVIGKDHRVLRWNRAMEELTGFDASEILGTDRHWMPFYEVQRPCMADLLVDDALALIPDWYSRKWSPSQLMDGAFEATDFFPHLGEDGKWLHLSGAGIRDSRGKLVAAIETLEDITERKRTEAAIISANQQLNDIIELLPDATFVVDRDNRIIAWNRAIEEMSGVSKTEMIGKGEHEWTLPLYGDRREHLLDLLDGNDEAVRSRYQYIERRGNVLRAEAFLPSAFEGRGAYVFATAAPLFDAHGNRVGAIESIRDITGRKRAEEALKESQQQLADIIDFLPDATFVVDRDGRVIAWNRAIEDMTGVSARDMLGKGNYEYALPFYGVRRPILIDLVLEAETGFESKYNSIRRRDTVLEGEAYTPAIKGGNACLYGKASILCDSKGRVVGAIESIRDITERKRVEEAYVLAEEKYRSIFENAIEGIFQTDLDGRILSANPAFARIVGYDSPEEITNAVTDVAVQLYADPERRAELVRQIHVFGTVQEFEARWCRKDGSIAYISLNVRAVYGEAGEIVFLEGTVQDITDRKALESRLLQAQKMEAIGTLAGGIAHDFNNILAAIMGYAEMTRNKLGGRHDLQLYLDQVLKSCDRAKNLVAQILTFSRKADQEIRPIDMGPLVKESLKMLRATLPSTIKINVNLRQDLCVVLAEPTHIHQVILNLCTNAAQAMREKGGVLEVGLQKIEVTPQTAILQKDLGPGPYVTLTVGDTGSGISPGILDRIFDPFFTTKQRGEGTGLGLSVVYGIVKRCGGIITVQSEIGGGSVFTVYLPAVSHELESEADSFEPDASGYERILFVDDEDTLVKMAQESLNELGYQVVTTTSSEKALELFRYRPYSFDLVITDMTMPGMTGASLAVELMKIRPDLPVILCTGFSELITEEQARSMGIREFILKPVSFREIARHIRRILSSPRARQAD